MSKDLKCSTLLYDLAHTCQVRLYFPFHRESMANTASESLGLVGDVR